MDRDSRLVGQARERAHRRMPVRERRLGFAVAAAFLLASAGLAVGLDSPREPEPLLMVGLIGLYVLVSRVEFEVGQSFFSPSQLVFLPMLLLAPPTYVPPMVAAALLLGDLPGYLRRETHPERLVAGVGDAWFAVGPAMVVSALAPGPPELALLWVYALAFAAQIGLDLLVNSLRVPRSEDVTVSDALRAASLSVRIDLALTPLAVVVAVGSYERPLGLVAILPLVWLLAFFSRERKGRYAAALELNRAYRGVVMLLSDVLEADDHYTADHSRSVVELASAVAERLDMSPENRRELEFAALLHDVGKIAIPKQILHKPAKLTEDEFSLIKTHTLEGQTMLDRVGGLLGRVGSIVRSCHERWDGAGYPDGLAGEAIPLPARIVFCCDAYNAMTTNRPYREALSHDDAVAELCANVGTQFDPMVVDALLEVVRAPSFELLPSTATHDVRQLLANRPLPPEVKARQPST